MRSKQKDNITMKSLLIETFIDLKPSFLSYKSSRNLKIFVNFYSEVKVKKM